MLGQILDRYRTSKGWQPLPEDDHRQMVAAWLEVLDIAGVPPEQYDNCYRAAVQAQMERKTRGQDAGPLGADDLAVEWLKIRQLHDEMEREAQNHRLLAENAAAACGRCFGKKPHVDTCDHAPLTEGEKRERAEAHAENARRLREMLAQTPAVRPMPPVESKEDLTVTFTCTECRRKVSSEFGWQYRDRCGVRLPGPVREGERLGCEGVMEVL